MTALLWACVLSILFGTVNAQAQSCTPDYQQSVNQCIYLLSDAVDTAPTAVDMETASPLLFMRAICERHEYRQAFDCALNGLKVCANIIGYPEVIPSTLRNIDETFINRICGLMPALEQNLPCLNGIANSSTFRDCIGPTVNLRDLCRSKMAAVMCTVSEVQIECPSIGELLLELMQLDFDPTCPIDSCMYELGSCLGEFRHDMPVEAIRTGASSFSAISHGINYICGTGKPNVECMMKGGSCRSFNSVMAFPPMFRIHLEPAGYLVNFGCKDINILTLKLQCMDEQFESRAFLECFNETLSTMNPYSIHLTPYGVVSCGLYQGASNCMKSIIARQCGEEAVDFYIKWSPAVFPLAEGCGSWKVSSSGSVENITTLMLLQLFIVMLFIN